MAENETLDLWKKYSPRRRSLLSLFRSDSSTPHYSRVQSSHQEWQTNLAAGRKRGWEWAGWLPASSAA